MASHEPLPGLPPARSPSSRAVLPQSPSRSPRRGLPPRMSSMTQLPASRRATGATSMPTRTEEKGCVPASPRLSTTPTGTTLAAVPDKPVQEQQTPTRTIATSRPSMDEIRDRQRRIMDWAKTNNFKKREEDLQEQLAAAQTQLNQEKQLRDRQGQEFAVATARAETREQSLQEQLAAAQTQLNQEKQLRDRQGQEFAVATARAETERMNALSLQHQLSVTRDSNAVLRDRLDVLRKPRSRGQIESESHRLKDKAKEETDAAEHMRRSLGNISNKRLVMEELSKPFQSSRAEELRLQYLDKKAH